eukprot:scaffold9048_cov74-Cylindrotheca_fusiformis.AAC.2
MASSETEENQQLEPPSPAASLLEDGSVSSTTVGSEKGILSDGEERKKPRIIIRRIRNPVNVVYRKANKKQGCPSTYTPRSSDGEEEGEEHFLENSGANNVGNGKDDGDDDGDDDDTSNKSPDASPAPSPPKNKRNWREEDHSVYQRGQIAKVMRSPTKTKNKGRSKRTGALISTETDTDESDDDDGKPNSTSTTISEAVNNELGEDVDAGLREAVELSRTVETNEVLDEIEASSDPNKHDRAVQEIIELWHPKLPTIVLFFWWAQRPASHFKVIASVLSAKTLAVQCGFTLLRLIVDLKNYYIRPTTNRNNFLPFGFRLSFAESKGRERIISEKTEKAPEGLHYVFSYLQQQQVLAQKDSMMGKIGMRDQNRKKRVAPVNEEDDSSGPDTSVIRTHTPDAFEKRVWLELEHRVLAYHIVRMVVHSTNSKSSFRSKHINRTNILSLSFAALSPCKERRLFVTVLANLCLLIDDKHSIKGHPSFKNVWEVREEHPQALYDAAHSTKLPPDEIDRHPSRESVRPLEEGVRNESKQWWVIRARVFSIWLKDFTFNAEKLKEVSSLALEDLGIVLSHVSCEDDEVSIGAASSVGGVGQSEADGRMAVGNVERFHQQRL